MSNIQLALDWMSSKQGRVTYSMSYRNGPNSYDCSSAAFYALRAGGFPYTSHIGNTETLFQLRGKLLNPISRADIRAGDVFVSGVPGGSSNAYGHTGFALNATQAIHCSSRFNGIGVSSNADSVVAAYGGAPVYWYRVVGSTAPSPTPEEPTEDESIYITEVNDGKEYLINEELAKVVGLSFTTETFDDVINATDLKQKGTDWMIDQVKDIQSMGLSFAQLDKLDERYKYAKLKKRDVITVQVPELNIDLRMRVDRKEFTLEEDGISDINLGRKIKNMTDLLVEGSGI